MAIRLRTTDFVFPGELRDRLNAAILSGEKTASSSLLVEYALDEQPLPRCGERLAVLDSQQRRVAVIEIVAVDVMPAGRRRARRRAGRGRGLPERRRVAARS